MWSYSAPCLRMNPQTVLFSAVDVLHVSPAEESRCQIHQSWARGKLPDELPQVINTFNHLWMDSNPDIIQMAAVVETFSIITQAHDWFVSHWCVAHWRIRITAGAWKSFSSHSTVAKHFLSSSIVSSKKLCPLINQKLRDLSCHFLTVKLALERLRVLTLSPMYILLNVLSVLQLI